MYTSVDHHPIALEVNPSAPLYWKCNPLQMFLKPIEAPSLQGYDEEASLSPKPIAS